MTVDLTDYIRAIPDFPEPGVLFRDVTPLLHDPIAYTQALGALTEYVRSRNPDAIVAVESRGFLFGAPIADRLKLPFVPVRKPGKLPAAVMSIEYALEYGSGQLDIHADALVPGQTAVIVDDLLATGGTAAGTVQLVERLGATVAGLAFLIELLSFNGRHRLTGYDVHALVAFP